MSLSDLIDAQQRFAILIKVATWKLRVVPEVAEKAISQDLCNLSLGQFQFSLLPCFQNSEIYIMLQLSSQIFYARKNYLYHAFIYRWATRKLKKRKEN